MMTDVVAPAASPAWSIKRVLGYSLLVLLATIAINVGVLVALAVVRVVGNPDFGVEEWALHADWDGVFVTVNAMAMAVVCIPLIRTLVGRREAAPWSFLRVHAVSAKAVLGWSAVAVAFAAAADLISLAVGRPIVSEFGAAVHASAPPLLLVAGIVIAAPLLEEVFFRGFLIGALEARGSSVAVSALVASLIWAASHTQYGIIDVTSIFLMGMLLAWARHRSGSIVPCIAMHCTINLIALVEAAIF